MKASAMLVFPMLVTGFAFSQMPGTQNIRQIMDSVANYTAEMGMERIYLQTDRSFYTAGDTIWFKAYVFNAADLYASPKSGIIYVELANDSSRTIDRVMLPVFSGLTNGCIALDKNIPPAGYSIRAYSNWMRNFDEGLLFRKELYVGNATDKDWLLQYYTDLDTVAGTPNAALQIKIGQFDKKPLGLREVKLTVSDGKKSLFKENVTTDVAGFAAAHFGLPATITAKPLQVSIEDQRKDGNHRKVIFPLAFNRPEAIDLQFMPEGGEMVGGIPARIAFKAINEDGTGADVAGRILDSQAQEVARFDAAHRGIGAFQFTPHANERYSASIKLPDGSYKTYALPAVADTGISLQVNNPLGRDSCEIVIRANPDSATADKIYYLIGHSRGLVCMGAMVNLNKGTSRIRLDKKIFPSGIARFSLINTDKQVLNERMIYIDHADNLHIHLTTDSATYGQRKPVRLSLKVTRNDGTPVQGSFSLAVTDDGQVNADTSVSIISRILLGAGLKGQVEDLAYYADAAGDPEKWEALNRLLLAQEWSGYALADAFKPLKAFPYAAEPEFLAKGMVTNAFNKPVANSGVTLFSQKPFVLLDTVTDAHGHFTFKGLYPPDSAAYFVQARNKRGKSFNVGIEMDLFQPPVFQAPDRPSKPWNVNVDSGLYRQESRIATLKKEQGRITGVNMLDEVVVIGKKVIKGSKNLNGPGEADVTIDESELQKAGRTTLGDLLARRIKGFGVRADKKGVQFYRIRDMLVHLIIDGMDTEFFLPEGTSTYQHFKTYFDYYDAEEIKGIEVMYSGRYQMRYSSAFLDPLEKFYDHAFIEVTTRGGVGPFLKKSVGTYLFRPMPFASPRRFYSPKYGSDAVADMTDIRSTIHWEPNIITDKNGHATLTFYTADHPGTYTIIVEGADMQGHVGTLRRQLTIVK